VEPNNEEQKRLDQAKGDPDGWRLWGPYLAERAWGTVREDYSADGSSWTYFPHDHARSRTYRWNEDGLCGISDIRQYLCFGLTLWNGQDAILKERLFGLTGPEGNHGEDVKEYYYYLDATPTHSYLKCLYKYPHRAFPYADLVATNRSRGRHESEYELIDTGIFGENRYFDVFVEYAKATPEDIAIRITIHNRGPEDASLHLLPTLWFRNTWSWGNDDRHPSLSADVSGDYSGNQCVGIRASHFALGTQYLICNDTVTITQANGENSETLALTPELLFCENETNHQRVFGVPNQTPYPKDAFHARIIGSDTRAVNPQHIGTKAAAWYPLNIPGGGSAIVKLRLRPTAPHLLELPGMFAKESFDALFETRIAEADAFYSPFTLPMDGKPLSEDGCRVQRQAFAGLIWSKQFYHYDVQKWIEGDPASPTPPAQRKKGRNSDWRTASMRDVLSMPDTWEYPWFAAWDLAFHMIPFAMIDPDFAKHQLLTLCREWYMHPSGKIPAYEWSFDDVNPPVLSWAALRIYKIERKAMGKERNEPGDTDFLERIFHKLLLNFTWWVNRKDTEGNNVFEGGFLGLDNIGVFDRSAPLPEGMSLEQCDGTAWMAMFCLNMLAIALELTRVNPAYQDVATKFAEHFVYIAHALTQMGDDGLAMWDEKDGFFYDILRQQSKENTESFMPMRIRSIVGLIPLFAVEAFDSDALNVAPDFLQRMEWFLRHRPGMAKDIAHITKRGQQDRILFSLINPDRLHRILSVVLDENEFLAPHGIRALSRYHKDHPFVCTLNGMNMSIGYEPAESMSGLFGGNSNWRGPIWFPINFLLIEALQKYDYVYGGEFMIEYPTGSGHQYDLWNIAALLSRRLSALFLQDSEGKRPVFGNNLTFQSDPDWRDHILFYEYFHGDNGAGIGASHQTGWTALVAKLLAQSGE
jgi:hypothetical protein